MDSDGSWSMKTQKRLSKRSSIYICLFCLWQPMMITNWASGLKNILLISSIWCRAMFNGLFISPSQSSILYSALPYGDLKESRIKSWQRIQQRLKMMLPPIERSFKCKWTLAKTSIFSEISSIISYFYLAHYFLRPHLFPSISAATSSKKVTNKWSQL